MAKRHFQLNQQEINQFRRAQQTRDVHELRRLQAVRLYGISRRSCLGGRPLGFGLGTYGSITAHSWSLKSVS